MFASMTAVGIANSSYFRSNVTAYSRPRPAIRLHYTGTNHDINYSYKVFVASINGSGSIIATYPTIPGAPLPKLAVSPSVGGQQITFTYAGDRGIAPVFQGEVRQLHLFFTHRDLHKQADNGCLQDEGPTVTVNGWDASMTFPLSGMGSATPITDLLCSVVVENRAMATFSAKLGETTTPVLPIPLNQVATLVCYLVPPAPSAMDALAQGTVKSLLATGEFTLSDLESRAWRAEMIDYQTIGHVYVRLRQELGLYFRYFGVITPQVFRNYYAPASPTVTLDLSHYATAPVYAFSLPFSTPGLSVQGVSTGTFHAAKTFSIQSSAGAQVEYSLDGGVVWQAYSGPVTLSTEGTYLLVARFTGTTYTSPVVTLTIDTTAPLAPSINGITSGTFTVAQTFTVVGPEASGTLYYSLDGGTTSTVYTGAVTLSEAPRTYHIAAWQQDIAGNVGTRTPVITLSLATPVSVTGITPASGLNNGVLTQTRITGTGFIAGTVTRLTRAGQPPVIGTSVSLTSTTSLTCSFDLTGLATGSWDVGVTTPDGLSATGTGLFMVSSPAPTITTTQAVTGTNTAVLANVQIAGTGFVNGATARLTRAGYASVAASTVTFTSSTQLSCSFDLTGLATGSWNIEVINPDTQVATGVNLLTIVAPAPVILPAPTIASIQPTTGANNEVLGSVQVNGTSFVDGATVRLTRAGQSSVAASSVAFTSSTRLSCSFNLNGLALGAWNVEVTNPDGQVATGANLLTVTTDQTAPAAPVFGSPVIPANLGGLGNKADLINAALKNAMGQFAVSLMNSSPGAENGQLELRLTDSLGSKALNSPVAIASGASSQNYGGFAPGAIDAFATGSITVEAVVVDNAGNRSATASVTLADCYHIPLALVLSGVPSATTDVGSATITVSGTGVTSYKYRYDGVASDPAPVNTPLVLASITSGLHTLEVLPSSDGTTWLPWSWATTATFTVTPWRVAFEFGRATTPSSSGDLSSPYGIAVSSAGKIHVVDSVLKVVKVYSSTGVYESEYGSSAAMGYPAGIAIDPSGNSWVTDATNDRIVKFSSTGTMLASWTANESDPRSIAINAAGDRLAIGCKSGYTVLIYNPANMLNAPQTFSIGSPDGMAFDASGSLHVAIAQMHKVGVIASDSAYTSWGTSGTGVGKLSGPTALAIGPDGNVYVYDSQKRIQRFTPKGNYLATIVPASIGNLVGLSVPSSGQLFFTNSGVSTYSQKLVWP